MHIVQVTDSMGVQYSYDIDKPIATVDDGLAFYTSQLSSVEARVYEVKYRNIVFMDFVPVSQEDPEWVDSVEYISYDAVTMGKFIAANGRDLPESDITANKSLIPVHYGGNSYRYSLDELRKSQQLRIPVDPTKARMSFRGFQEHAQRVAFFGDSERNITGIWNNANVPQDNSALDYATATGAEIVADMQDLLIDLWQGSAEVHLANVLVLPSNIYAIISARRMDSGTDTTVLEFFRANNLYTQQTGAELTIRSNFELQTANAAGTGGRMVAYELNDENLTMRMPMPWRAVAPQPDGLTIKVPAEYKFGGVEFRYPGSARYRDFS